MKDFVNKYSLVMICLISFASSLASSDHGFESGNFSAWPLSTPGTTVLDVAPYSGNYHGLLSCTFSQEQPLSDFEIESLLGLAVGAIDDTIESFSNEAATNGSVISGEFYVATGRTLSFAINFQTGELPGNQVWNDSALWIVKSSSSETVIPLTVIADTYSMMIPTNMNYEEFGFVSFETGYFELSFTARQSDSYTFSCIVVNDADTSVASTLSVDSLDIESVQLGDINQDGNVDLLDVSPFIALLGSGEFLCEADTNQDGQVSLLDVGLFVELLAAE